MFRRRLSRHIRLFRCLTSIAKFIVISNVISPSPRLFALREEFNFREIFEGIRSRNKFEVKNFVSSNEIFASLQKSEDAPHKFI